jgi:hypothetical protein
VLNEIVVSAARAPQPAENAAATVRVLTADDLARGPAATLDGALRAIPAFGLFRRADSLAANPTAQGVSLRGLGPSGASRSLVLLDGVPLNDPFGGWVAWTKLPRDTAWRAEIVPGGGATAWGNAALGGVVQILTAPEPFSPMHASIASAQLSASGGTFGAREAEFSTSTPVGGGEARLLGRAFATDGYTLVAPERRGAIDTPAWSRHRWVVTGWRRAPGDGSLGIAINARAFDETRGNGTPFTGNRSREQFASVALGGRPEAGFAWDAVAYAQDQAFASTFSSVNAARSAETPASDQHDVPASAFGAAWTGSWRGADGARASAGADLRLVRGETREYFTYAGGRFTRERIAGGRQLFAGLFLLREQALATKPASGGKSNATPAWCSATTASPPYVDPRLVRTPGSSGTRPRAGGCAPTPSTRSAGPPSTSFIAHSGKAPTSRRPIPCSAPNAPPAARSARNGKTYFHRRPAS